MKSSQLNTNLTLVPALTLSFLALYPTDNFFRKISLQTFITIKEQNLDFGLLKKSIVKKTLKQTSYEILYPLLGEVQSPLIEKRRTKKKHRLLKQYLRKFNFLYRSYFLEEVPNYAVLPDEKEINSMAIIVLFQFLNI